ncbi:hypothetical protein [[Clostridium] fimetarium]|uniref:Lipoprotein n=1 Tax=[Clostridium] fimetarium TaxID=99656 RepID=A0A1I0RSC0_9FIRM|nr:hypothetical protein [[Clostridium] fimetarium]SEW44159.1 hypothetical protein SAMN05421659_1229 [[Clostridium] fimetarium]
MKIRRKFVLFIIASFVVSLCACGHIIDKTASNNSTSNITINETTDNTVLNKTESNNTVSTESTNTESSNLADGSSFEGEWNRTNIPKAFGGRIKITNQKNDFFDFDFRGWYGAHSGIISGTAQITDKYKSIFTYKDKYSNKTAIVTFIIDNGQLTVSAENNSALGFGFNVIIDGNYTIAEPNYTNANLIDSIFPRDADKEKAKNLLGQTAYEQMLDVMDLGIQYINDKLNYSGYIQGAGEGVDIKIDCDFYYILGYWLETSGYTLYTNDPAFQATLPDFFTKRTNATLNFVYKSLP